MSGHAKCLNIVCLPGLVSPAVVCLFGEHHGQRSLLCQPDLTAPLHPHPPCPVTGKELPTCFISQRLSVCSGWSTAAQTSGGRRSNHACSPVSLKENPSSAKPQWGVRKGSLLYYSLQFMLNYTVLKQIRINQGREICICPMFQKRIGTLARSPVFPG